MMKTFHTTKLIFLLFIIFPFIPLKAKAIDYLEIINHVNNTPINVKNSTIKLSVYLCEPFKTEKEKFASIFYWIAKNISYNDVQAKTTIYYESVDEIIEQVMKSKSGVCQHFSELFARLARHAGLEVYVVNGYTRTNGKVDNLSHAWNIIKTNDKYSFIDATWAGAALKTISKNKFPEMFFMMTPEENLKRRMPFDPIWQALPYPVKYQEFDKNSEKTATRKDRFNYADSINAYNNSELIDKQTGIMRRMKANGTFNPLVAREYDLMEKNYEMLLFNQEVVKYNQATALYNNGMKYFNQYVKIKNNKTYLKNYSRQQLEAITDSASVNLQKAEKIFEVVSTNNAEMIGYIKKNMVNIEKANRILIKERKFILNLPK